MFYRLKEDGTILDSADFKYADNCLETDKNIVVGFDGALRFEEETKTAAYQQAKAQADKVVETNNQIAEKKAKLDELTKDLAQVQAGLIVDNIEEKKAEFRTLLNEVRVLQGKEPRNITE